MDTTTKWAFLQPWLGALLDSLAHHNDDDDDEAQLIQADLDCWPEDLDEYSFDEPDFTVGEWNLFVDFPADDASRRDREGLQRIREAIELFNFLAVVDNKSFRTLLSDFVGAADSNCIVHPVWQCSLAGILPQGDPIAQRAEVTWGAIFGCPHDPWEYSPTFRDAMLKLEELDAECDDESDDEDYVGGINSSLHWFIQSEAVPMKGIQETKVYSASKSTCEDLSRKMGELFGLHAPPMVHVCAVVEKASVVNAWRQLDSGVVPLDTVEIYYPTFVGPAVPELTAALARTTPLQFQLHLSEQTIPRQQRGLAIANAGFMFSSIFCGRSVCKPQGTNSNIAELQQEGEIDNLELRLRLATNTDFAILYSALAEATSIADLVIRLVEDDELANVPARRSHWAWLAYACGHPTAKRYGRSVSVTSLSLSAHDVSIVQQVVKNCYPQPVKERHGDVSQYGFANVRAGSKLRPCGLGGEDDTNLLLTRDYRFRALYDPVNMQNQVEVVVPGYGVCQVGLSDGVNTFIPDTAELLDEHAKVHGSLHLNFYSVESGRSLTDLLALITGNVRSLSIGILDEEGVDLDLSAVAAACPRLKELRIDGFNVRLSLQEESLRNWGIQRLTIMESHEVAGVAECLKDKTYRMSRELVELEISRHNGRISHTYVDALKLHDGEKLPIAEKLLPLDAKAALISVISWEDQSAGKAKATRKSVTDRGPAQRSVHRVGKDILRLIFELAAAPKQRIVEVTT